VGASVLPIIAIAACTAAFLQLPRCDSLTPPSENRQLGRNASVPTRPASVDPADIPGNQVNEIGPGLVIFNPSTEMTVGYRELITVEPLQGYGAAQTERIKIGSFMRARLFGEGICGNNE
jgi:hypothetical protein